MTAEADKTLRLLTRMNWSDPIRCLASLVIDLEHPKPLAAHRALADGGKTRPLTREALEAGVVEWLTEYAAALRENGLMDGARLPGEAEFRHACAESPSLPWLATAPHPPRIGACPDCRKEGYVEACEATSRALWQGREAVLALRGSVCKWLPAGWWHRKHLDCRCSEHYPTRIRSSPTCPTTSGWCGSPSTSSSGAGRTPARSPSATSSACPSRTSTRR